jgi:hypothetical protein
MTQCPTCGANPCANFDFCTACRAADTRKARRDPPEPIFSVSQATVEALMWSLRERGTKALEEPGTKRRLSELNNQQVIEVGNRLQRLKPEIARAWSTTEVETLFQARIEQ